MSITAWSDVGGARPLRADLHDWRALREMLALTSTEVGPVLGVSSFLGAGEAAGGAYAGHAELYDLDGLMRDLYQQPSMEAGVNDTLFGGGKGTRLDGALLSTLGEAAERVVAAMVGCSPHLPGPRMIGSFRDMVAEGLAPLDPSAVTLFSQAQHDVPGFLYTPFTQDTVVQWVEGRRLVSGEPVWVPGQLVDMVHIYDPDEELVGYPVSGGLSCHTSWRAAVYHGLTEVVERDAINVSWYTDAPPRRLQVDDRVRSLLGGFVDRLQLDHSASALLLHPSDVCSVATISAVGQQQWLARRRYCAGGGADAVATTALHKAAAEFGQTRATLGQSITAPHSAVGISVTEMFDWEPDRPLAEMTLFFQAIGYYGLAEHEHLLADYLAGEPVTLDEVIETGNGLDASAPTEERLEVVLEELTARGIDPIVLDYSHPEWQQLAIAKVFVPELTTPFLQSRPMLGHPRLARLRDGVRLPGGGALPLPYP